MKEQKIVSRQKAMLVVLALCSTYTAFAQNACHPFACEGKVWHYWSEANEDYSYTLTGDTVVGDKTMKRLFLTDRKAYGDDRPRYVGAIHEDGGRVSFFPDGTAEGKTVCDFNAVAGEKVSVNDDLYRVVYSDSYLLVDSDVRHYQELLGVQSRSHPNQEQLSMTFPSLEGIGLLFEDPFRGNANNRKLAYCQEGERYIYYSPWIFSHPVADKYYAPVNPGYKPLLRDGRKWELADGSSWTVCGDTILQDTYLGLERKTVWRKVYRTDSKVYADQQPHYEKAVMEYGKKVYEVKVGLPASSKSLLFDFGLGTGDRFQMESMPDVYAVVESLDSVTSMGISHYRLTLQIYQDGVASGHFFHWTEGVGSEWGMEASYDISAGTPSISVYDDNECVYLSNSVNHSQAILKSPMKELFHDLQGRSVTGFPRPGIYIENGRKRVVSH